MVAKCTTNLWPTILENAENLKGNKSHCGDIFSINEQLPHKLSEEHKEAYECLKIWKAWNATLSEKQKVKVEVQ